jgi:hypothetical protein
LCTIQIHSSALRDRKKTALQILHLTQSLASKYHDRPLLLGTIEYSIHRYLIELGIPVRFLPHEIGHNTDLRLWAEAQEFAQDLIRSLSDEPRLLFKGVNILDAFLYDVAIQFRSILRIDYLAKNSEEEPGVMILFVGPRISLSNGPKSAFRDIEMIRIGKPRNKIWSVLRRIIGIHASATVSRNGTPPIPEQGKRQVLFLATDNGTANWAEPLVFVLAELKKREDIEFLVAVDNQFTEKYFKERHFECVRHIRFLNSDAQSHWSTSHPILEKNAMKLRREYGPGTLRGLMVSTFLEHHLKMPLVSEAYSRAIWLDEIFQRFRPEAVVIFALISYLGIVGARMARIRNIPTLSWVGTWPHGEPPNPEFALYDLTDFVAGYGDQFNQTLATSGVDPGKLIPVGNPKFDAIRSRRVSDDRNHVCRLLRINSSSRILLVATYMLAPGTIEWVQALVRQLKKLQPEAFKLIIKPHPDENTTLYKSILQKEAFADAVITKDFPLYVLLNACDIVFTTTSTVGSEAILFNKPMICINLTGIPYSVRYDEDGAALLVRNESEILPAIQSVLKDENVREKLQNARQQIQNAYGFALDGRSSERFVLALTKVLDSHVPSVRRHLTQ